MIEFLKLESRRLVRRPEAWAPILGGTVLFLVGLTIERASTSEQELRDVFGRATFPVLLSLLGLSIAHGVSGGSIPSPTAKIALRAGLSRPSAITATVLLASILATIVFPAAGTLALSITRDVPPGDSSLALGILCLAAPAYAAGYCLALTWGMRGAVIFWILDYVVGSSGGSFAAAFPRSHVRNLFGAMPPFGVSQFASSLFLAMLPILYLALTIFRGERLALLVPTTIRQND